MRITLRAVAVMQLFEARGQAIKLQMGNHLSSELMAAVQYIKFNIHFIKKQNKGTMRRKHNLFKEVTRYRKHECL